MIATSLISYLFLYIKQNIKSKYSNSKLKLMALFKQNQNRREMINPKYYDESSLEHINQGTFGTIYRARSLDKLSHQLYAIKKIPLQFQKSGFPAYLIKEISLLKHLNHQNIIQLIEYHFKERYAYLVFDYFHSDLSRRILQDISISTDMQKIKSILRQILQGIQHMHKKGIIHRDIKPTNILIDQNGHIVICDFGSARRMLTINPPYTQNMGTLWYRAPEILLRVKRYDEKVDLWSIGCVFAEMLLKQIFFEGINEIRQISIILQTLGRPTVQSWPELFENPKNGAFFQDIVNEQSTLACKIRANTQIQHSKEFEQGIDLLEKLLVINPKNRISATGALRHPFLQ